MFEIVFYADTRGHEPVVEYIRALAVSRGKDSRIKLNKIQEYIQMLRVNGLCIGEPYIKPVDGEIWELRPLRDRIFFFCWKNKAFVLLHHFMKKSRKTPKREIEQARRNMLDHIKRSQNDEE